MCLCIPVIVAAFGLTSKQGLQHDHMGYLDLWRNTPYMPEVTDMLETTDSFGMPDVTSPQSMPTCLLEVPP